MNQASNRRRALALAGTLAASLVASGCAPLIIGGAAVGSALVVTDRRTSGAQLEDQAIELKAGSRVRELGTLGHVNVTSYNRAVLITGEVPDQAARAAVEKVVSALENVRSVVNELAVMPNSAMSARSNDALLSTKVKATFVDARDLQAQAFKVTTERSTVYLLGLVTEREADRATALARAIPGVQKVVRVLELVSEAELARLQPRAAP